ncbi:Polymer-forming cytoskeletal [Neomoorella glycerini]|uniref:Polymer-forming cytoskeletal n=1 Tax=Neomoorella glycerini TaxID=55779 RepID=A0A6I5ZPK2_9FIRM|nr:polymer-forming cytoskeletal protein [Moorella glycerini]QGP91914.1 Polymer-forming cytoskeletal [Moorella glycerini]
MLGKKNDAVAATVDTVIGKGAKITGKLVAEGAVRIDGNLEGEVSTEGDLVVGESGQVVATVRARNLLVVGAIKGDVVTTGQLEIAPTGKVEGDVQTVRLIVEPGGLLQGHCQMPLAADS